MLTCKVYIANIYRVGMQKVEGRSVSKYGIRRVCTYRESVNLGANWQPARHTFWIHFVICGCILTKVYLFSMKDGDTSLEAYPFCMMVQGGGGRTRPGALRPNMIWPWDGWMDFTRFGIRASLLELATGRSNLQHLNPKKKRRVALHRDLFLQGRSRFYWFQNENLVYGRVYLYNLPRNPGKLVCRCEGPPLSWRVLHNYFPPIHNWEFNCYWNFQFERFKTGNLREKHDFIIM